MRTKWIAGAVFSLLVGSFAVPSSLTQTASEPSSVPVPTDQSDAGEAAPISPPARPITVDQTREMFQLMNFNAMMARMLHITLQRERENAPLVPEDVWQDFETSFAKVDFVQVFLPVYQKYLSEDDAAKALEFYRTPAGQHTLRVMPSLMQQLAVTSQAEGEKIGQEVFERHRQEIEDAQKKAAPSAPPSEEKH